MALLLCTRQAGKSTVTAALGLYTALTTPGALVLLIAPALRQSQELFAKMAQMYRALEGTLPVRRMTALQLELTNDARVLALPGNEKTVRGFSGVDLLIIDEASRVEDTLYHSLRPMLAVSGGRLICLTTPFGQRGFFYEEWSEGGDGWHRIEVPATACPRISEAFLAEERRAMGDRWFSQEYGCTFVSATGSVFRSEDIAAAFTDTVMPLHLPTYGTS
ncbi:MAG: terminase family protein [Bacteroidota bacterium]